MLKNYLRIALRNLTRNRFSSAINIGGLAIGMSVATLIGLWIYDEVSFNTFSVNHKRIAAVLQNQNLSGGIETWWGEAMQLGPTLRKEFPNQFKYVVTGAGTDELLSYGDKKIKRSGAFYDPAVIDMFSMTMLKGDHLALQDPSAILLSASTARALFADTDPMGKTVKLNNSNKDVLKVAGIYADLPLNSDWSDVFYLSSFQALVNMNGWTTTNKLEWGNSWFRTYVMLNDKADMAAASKAIKDVKFRYSPSDQRFNPVLFLHPLDRWHLYSDFENGVATGGRIQYVRLFSLIGIFVLLLACINFMNLSTARSEKRAREVGIRKAIGSLRGQLIGQFFSESVLIALFSFVAALIIAQLLLPFFNQVAGKTLSIPWGHPVFWLTGLGFTIATGLIAGSYPALYLSSFQPIKVLKGSFRVGRLAALPRKALVVVQFTVSVILIVGTIAVFRQIQYVKDRPVGYTREGLLVANAQSSNIAQHFKAISDELKQTGLVSAVSGSQQDLTNSWSNNMGYKWEGKDPNLQESFFTNTVTPDFGKSVGWQIMQGRDFSSQLATDSGAFIINEAAVKYMNLRNPIGKIVRWGDNGVYTIIGVAKDMISQSAYGNANPMIFNLTTPANNRINKVNIRLAPSAGVPRAIAAIQAIFKKYDPENSFEYQFADEEFAKKFGDEERIGKLAGFFTLLAIFISCLGLLGLSAFVAEQRTREIGVRKVLGATVFNLWNLLSREFVLLVSISLLIGGPIAYWVMHSWLQNYAVHATLSWWIFALTAAGSVALTLFTVSYQAIKTALANPVKSLRTE
jgi:putative ABC transport system permease protein